MKKVGFSTIFFNALTEEEKLQILRRYDIFDISPAQVDLVDFRNVLSVQAIFFGHDISRMSLVNDDYSFDLLFALFREVVDKLKDTGYKSLIFGSPSLRKVKNIADFDSNIAFRRFESLYKYAKERNLVLYMEALPKEMCDYITTHSELIEFTKKMSADSYVHVDFATMISNGENIGFLEKNISSIGRYHISIPEYSFNFTDYPFIKDWINFLDENHIYGIVEIQKMRRDRDLMKELEWLTRGM